MNKIFDKARMAMKLGNITETRLKKESFSFMFIEVLIMAKGFIFQNWFCRGGSISKIKE